MNDFELIYLARQKSCEAEEMLLKKYEALIHLLIFRVKNHRSKVDENDLFLIGQFAVLKAVYLFDDTRKIKFSTFVYTIIYRDLIREVNRYTSNSDVINSSVSIENEELYLVDYLSPARICEAKVEYETVLKKVKNFSSVLEFKVYDLKLYGFTRNEIATKLNLTYKEVDNCLNRIKSKVKRNLR